MNRTAARAPHATTTAARTAIAEPTAVEPTGANTQEQEQDPAGGISLSGRNRLCIRARALAGMVLTSGIVVALGTTDTTSSMHHNILG